MTLKTPKSTNQPSLFVEDSHAKDFPKQDSNEERKMTAISGEKCLMSSNTRNPDGLLQKMCEELLRHKMAWHSTLCILTWKVKVTKSKRLIYQLSAKVRGTKGKESGLLLTPTAINIGVRSEESKEKRKKFRESIGRKTVPPGNLAEQIMDRLLPTPTAGNSLDVTMPVEYIKPNSSGWSVTRKKTGTKFGAKLNDAVKYLDHYKLLPTPTASEHKYRLKGNLQQSKCLEANARRAGGKLNPDFVEFLMGLPQGWTKIVRKD